MEKKKTHHYFFGQMNAPWKKSPEEQLSELQQLLKEYFRLKDMIRNRDVEHLLGISSNKLSDIEAELRRMVGYEGDNS
jgi:hypothetical protein